MIYLSFQYRKVKGLSKLKLNPFLFHIGHYTNKNVKYIYQLITWEIITIGVIKCHIVLK